MGVLFSHSSYFQRLYALNERPSIPPEKLLRALLLQGFYSVGSERQLIGKLDCNHLFRGFADPGIDDRAWDVSVFTKNRDRLLDGAIAGKFIAGVLARPELAALMSDEHFSVDGTLIQAWASMKSFRPKDGSGELPGARPQRRARLKGREAVERDPCLDHRCRRAAVPHG